MDRPKRNHTPVSYSEVFRLIGSYVEDAHLTEIRVLETAEGIILQGLVNKGEHTGERATYQLTSDDLQMLLDDALAKRGKRM